MAPHDMPDDTMPQGSQSSAVRSLLKLLDLDPLEVNLFRGQTVRGSRKHVFGGQVIAQALMAAMRTVEDRQVHSLHAYFLLPGDPSAPILYEVDRIRDGRSFTTRRVVAIQHGEAIFSMSASFQREETGLDYQAQMPDVPMPEELMTEAQMRERYASQVPETVRQIWSHRWAIEIRPTRVDRFIVREPVEPARSAWFRTVSALPDDQGLHRCVLAYASDALLLDTAVVAHGLNVFDARIRGASIDHAIWFHRPFRADEWLLYTQESPSSCGARGFSRGSLLPATGPSSPRWRRKA